MSLSVVFACMTALALNVALGLLGVGSFGHFLLVVAAVLFASVLVGVGAGVLTWNTSAAARRDARNLLYFGIVLGSTIISIPLGLLVNHYEVDRAKRYCEGLRPELERYRQLNGRYPDRLSLISVPVSKPWLLRGVDFYEVKNGGYRFTVVDQSRLLAGFDFDSQTGEWCYWD